MTCRKLVLQELQAPYLLGWQALEGEIALMRLGIECRGGVAGDKLAGCAECDEAGGYETQLRPPPADNQHERSQGGDGKAAQHGSDGGLDLLGAGGEIEAAHDGHGHQRRRDADESDGDESVPPGAEFRQAIGDVAMHQIAGRHREREIDDEGGVGGSPVEVDAGNMVEEQVENRRVAAEGIEEGADTEDEEIAEVARQNAPAGNSVPEEQQRRQRSREQVGDGAVGPGALRQRLRAGTPIVVACAQRAEYVAEQRRREARRMQRAHDGNVVGDLRTVGIDQKLDGEEGGHREDDDACQGDGAEQQQTLAQPCEGPLGRHPGVDHGTGKGKAAQEGDLVAAYRHHGGHDGKQNAEEVRAARQRFLEQQQGEREEPVAEDHAGVLQPCRGGTAEDEQHGGDNGAGCMPAAAAEEADYAECAGDEMREDDEIEKLHRRRRHEPAEQQHRGREEQRLRVGHRGVATEVIGIPQRPFAVGQRRAEIAQHGIEVVLGIPWDDGADERPNGGRRCPEGHDDEHGKHGLADAPAGKHPQVGAGDRPWIMHVAVTYASAPRARTCNASLCWKMRRGLGVGLKA